jgi:hypothetical protein
VKSDEARDSWRHEDGRHRALVRGRIVSPKRKLAGERSCRSPGSSQIRLGRSTIPTKWISGAIETSNFGRTSHLEI